MNRNIYSGSAYSIAMLLVLPSAIPLNFISCKSVLLTAALAVVSLSFTEAKPAAQAVPYTAYQPSPNFPLPEIVLQYDPVAKTGADWAKVSQPIWSDVEPDFLLGRAANYLRDGLTRMTGKEYHIVSKNDLSKGIVLTLLKNASPDIQNDPEIQKALAPDPKDTYAAKEAFFLRTEKDRILVVANTPDGLTDAVSELLDTVNYEVLGYGVDWIYVPNHRTTPLVFNVKRADRPSFYIRFLWIHSGQSYAYGTLMDVRDPSDEIVSNSLYRWMIGTKMLGKSMASFPGHALQIYANAITAKMRETGNTQGYLAHVAIGLLSARPAASTENKDTGWINTDPKDTPGFAKTYVSDGKEWKEVYQPGSVDVSVPYVRDLILEDMKVQSEAFFKANPDDLYVFPTDAEDGETPDADRAKTQANKNWYPEYLAKEGLPFGRPYLLNGYKGLNQPVEIWDGNTANDNIYGYTACMLHEYDKWIDSLPKDQQVTSTGKSKKAQIRGGLQSYNFHDVPPNFNPDPRTRVAMAPFPKNRGIGKWEKLVTQDDMAQAFQILLPGEPSANYSFYSNSHYDDHGPAGIPERWNPSPKAISDTYRRFYDVGFRSITFESDLNFAKCGLGYYLASKMLWNAKLTPKELDAIRDRWFQRAFGSAWKEMKAYYDFLLPENFPANGPNAWAKAIRLLDVADKKIATVAAKEPAAQKRIDDVKQFWYMHYLFDTDKFAKDSPEVREYLWKGQMSYMVSMHGLLGRNYRRDMQTADIKALVGPEISAGPAHFTHEETQAWWPKILDTWKVTPVSTFADAKLANGKPARAVDVNDLVFVKELQMEPTDVPFYFNSGYMIPGTFLEAAAQKGAVLGFKLFWPYHPEDTFYIAKKLPYGVDIWDAAHHTWTPWLDKTTTDKQSVEMTNPAGAKIQVVDVQLKAPQAGTYRFALGFGGNAASLASATYDPQTGKYAKPMGFTYFNSAVGLTQSGVYVYIPKGTKSFDLDVTDVSKVKFVTFHTGLPDKGMKVTRKVDIGSMGTHVVPLQPGEDGTVALIEGNNFTFPFLYSVPSLWAKSPAALLVPRAVAEADGLTPMDVPAKAVSK